MSVIIETTIGDITIDLFTNERPRTCLNFLKLCKTKYYNLSLVFSVQRNFIAQMGDPTGTGQGGDSVFTQLFGNQARFFEGEKNPVLKHHDVGTVSMVSCGDDHLFGSQFFITLGENLDSLDNLHLVFGKVVEGMDIVGKLNETITAEDNRPYKEIMITHTVILNDPFPDPERFECPDQSPQPSREILESINIAIDENIDDDEGMDPNEVVERLASKEAEARAVVLEMVGDLPEADMAPPENVLFVCKLNPVTTSDDLMIIFSRFGQIETCEVITDFQTGNSLQYAFIEFKDTKSCENAYFKMDNVLIDERRIHVDFSQSVSKIKWKGKGRIEYYDDYGKRTNKQTGAVGIGDERGKLRIGQMDRESGHSKPSHKQKSLGGRSGSGSRDPLKTGRVRSHTDSKKSHDSSCKREISPSEARRRKSRPDATRRQQIALSRSPSQTRKSVRRPSDREMTPSRSRSPSRHRKQEPIQNRNSSSTTSPEMVYIRSTSLLMDRRRKRRSSRTPSSSKKRRRNSRSLSRRRGTELPAGDKKRKNAPRRSSSSESTSSSSSASPVRRRNTSGRAAGYHSSDRKHGRMASESRSADRNTGHSTTNRDRHNTQRRSRSVERRAGNIEKRSQSLDRRRLEIRAQSPYRRRQRKDRGQSPDRRLRETTQSPERRGQFSDRRRRYDRNQSPPRRSRKERSQSTDRRRRKDRSQSTDRRRRKERSQSTDRRRRKDRSQSTDRRRRKDRSQSTDRRQRKERSQSTDRRRRERISESPSTGNSISNSRSVERRKVATSESVSSSRKIKKSQSKSPMKRKHSPELSEELTKELKRKQEKKLLKLLERDIKKKKKSHKKKSKKKSKKKKSSSEYSGDSQSS